MKNFKISENNFLSTQHTSIVQILRLNLALLRCDALPHVVNSYTIK